MARPHITGHLLIRRKSDSGIPYVLLSAIRPHGLKPGGFYGDEQTPYRRVKWFKPVNELRIPSEISDVLRTPTAISLLPQTYYKNILELSYNSYIRGDEVFCKFNIDTDDFNAKNTFDLGALAQLAVAIASDIPASELSATLLNYLDANFPADAQPTLTLNMNSWGSGGYRGSNYAPLVLGCLLAYLPLALADPAKTQIKIVNSVERSDACVTDADKPVTSDIEERVAERLVLIGVPALKKACERALHLKQEGKLHTDTRAK